MKKKQQKNLINFLKSNLQNDLVNVCINSVRYRKKGGPSQSQGPKYKEKYYGLKGLPGAFCNEFEVIATQPDSKFHPGLNVSV